MNYVLNMLPELWTGAKITLSLFAITLLLSIPLGLVLALLRLSKSGRWIILLIFISG